MVYEPRGTTVFVTGGTGFLGREILRSLQEAHPRWHIVSYDLYLPARSDARPGVEYIQGDILNSRQLTSALGSSSPSAVIHAAGLVTPIDQRYGRKLRSLVWRVNVEGTANVLTAAQATPSVRAFVWTGSCCAVVDDFRHDYPNIDESWTTCPSSHNTIYGESKAVAEVDVLAANDPDRTVNGLKSPFLACSLRPSALFGDTDSQLIVNLHGLMQNGESSFVIGDGLNLQDYCHASNAADAHVLAVENLLGSGTAAGEAFFIGNDEPIPFRTLCLAIWKEFGHVPPFEVRLPTGLAWTAGYLLERASWAMGREAVMRRESVLDATATRYADGKKAREILGYKPRLCLQEGIARSCRLYKERLEQRRSSEPEWKVSSLRDVVLSEARRGSQLFSVIKSLLPQAEKNVLLAPILRNKEGIVETDIIVAVR